MWKKFLLLLFGCACALIVGEVVARNVLTEEKFIADPLLEWKGNPQYGHDANGFRNAEVPQTVSIVAIGDSQTYGANATMEEAWPQTLARLRGEPVYQLAFGGYGPTEYSILFDRALELQPKTVVVAFFSGNDLRDTADDVYSREYWKDMRRDDFTINWTQDAVVDPDANLILQYGLDSQSMELSFLKLKNLVYNQSKLYIFLGKGSRALREKLNLTDTLHERDQKAFAWTKEHPEAGIAFERGNISTILAPKLRSDTIDLDDPNTQEGFRLTQELFASMHDRAKGKTQVAFVYIPTKEFVYSHIADLGDFRQKEERLRQAFLEFCATIQVACVDTTPKLVEALGSDVSIVSLGTDGHYHGGGYGVIAKTIADEIFE